MRTRDISCAMYNRITRIFWPTLSRSFHRAPCLPVLPAHGHCKSSLDIPLGIEFPENCIGDSGTNCPLQNPPNENRKTPRDVRRRKEKAFPRLSLDIIARFHCHPVERGATVIARVYRAYFANIASARSGMTHVRNNVGLFGAATFH